jgi:hypothetical protein
VTLTIPRWLLMVLGLLVVGAIAVGGYLLGKASDEGDEATISTGASDEDSGSTPPAQTR